MSRGKKGCAEPFEVNNFESTYVGQRTLANALTYSDNAVYAAVGIKVGTKRVARLAQRMGIRTPISTNLAMTLGGLREGVTPLDMAHAYDTFQTGGRRVTGTLGAKDDGPVGIVSVEDKKGRTLQENRTERLPVLTRQQAQTATQVMSTVVSQGTGKRAAIGQFAAGKTGTTENSGDAWFVGFTDRLTVAVWVGYPDTLKPMEHDFQGGPVEGGTFPALIWHDFQLSATSILDKRIDDDRRRHGLPPRSATGASGPVATPATGGQATPTSTPTPTAPVAPAAGTAPAATTPAPAATPKAVTPTPAPTPKPKPAPTPVTPPAATPTPGGAGTAGGAGAPAASG